MKRTLAPIAVFAFNRPLHLAEMLSSLSRCALFSETAVTVFIDGPRRHEDISKITAVHEAVVACSFPNVEVRLRSKNLGLRASIAAGVSELCAEFGRVIVLEDDFVLSDDALIYFNEALDKYHHDSSVMSVCAYVPAAPHLENLSRAIFLPQPHPWGWATWDRAWRGFDLDQRVDSNIARSRSFRDRFNVHGTRNFAAMLRLEQQSLISSWFIRWHYFVATRNGLCVFPPRTLIVNLGQDGGTHSSSLNLLRFLVPQRSLGSFDFDLPDIPHVDFEAIDSIRKSREGRVSRIVSDIGYIRRKAAQLWRRAIAFIEG